MIQYDIKYVSIWNKSAAFLSFDELKKLASSGKPPNPQPLPTIKRSNPVGGGNIPPSRNPALPQKDRKQVLTFFLKLINSYIFKSLLF